MPNETMGERDPPQSPEVATSVVVVAVAGFLGFVALSMIGLFFYLRSGAPDAFRKVVEHSFPEPALQKNPRDDLTRFELLQRAALSGYDWVDQSRGLARIPIEEAMRIIASRGDRAYDPLDRPASGSDAGSPDGARR